MVVQWEAATWGVARHVHHTCGYLKCEAEGRSEYGIIRGHVIAPRLPSPVGVSTRTEELQLAKQKEGVSAAIQRSRSAP